MSAKTEKKKRGARQIRVPMRRCIGCMESKPKADLIRIAWYEGALTVDPDGKAKGRGVYLCPDESCLKQAKKRNAFRRSFRANIPDSEIDRVIEEIETSGVILEHET